MFLTTSWCIYVIVVLVGMLAPRNLSDGAVHVFSSCLVCFEELTFQLMFFQKWLRDKQFYDMFYVYSGFLIVHVR